MPAIGGKADMGVSERDHLSVSAPCSPKEGGFEPPTNLNSNQLIA
jgi:hypothetical protein